MDQDIFRFTLEEELTMLVRILIALLVGGLVGFERRITANPAGIRTMSLVAAGACIFTLVSIFGFRGLGTTQDPGRVAAQIVTGVGFIGAGTMIATASGAVKGLTTASSIWVVASLGMAAGTGMYAVAIAGGIIAAAVMHFLRPRQDQS
jgi:putative Mg2+ transporter-C (MgtC) family protein